MKIIKISEEVSNYLITRTDLKNLFDNIDRLSDEEIIIDFKDVSFISRSCADEYLKLKNKINKKIDESNLMSDVRIMFEVVKFQLEKEREDNPSLIAPIMFL